MLIPELNLCVSLYNMVNRPRETQVSFEEVLNSFLWLTGKSLVHIAHWIFHEAWEVLWFACKNTDSCIWKCGPQPLPLVSKVRKHLRSPVLPGEANHWKRSWRFYTLAPLLFTFLGCTVNNGQPLLYALSAIMDNVHLNWEPQYPIPQTLFLVRRFVMTARKLIKTGNNVRFYS